jgi:hypothetical protein
MRPLLDWLHFLPHKMSSLCKNGLLNNVRNTKMMTNDAATTYVAELATLPAQKLRQFTSQTRQINGQIIAHCNVGSTIGAQGNPEVPSHTRKGTTCLSMLCVKLDVFTERTRSRSLPAMTPFVLRLPWKSKSWWCSNIALVVSTGKTTASNAERLHVRVVPSAPRP